MKRSTALRLASLVSALSVSGGFLGWAWLNGLAESYAAFGSPMLWVALTALTGGLAGYGLGRNQRAVRWPEDRGRASWVRVGGIVGGVALLGTHLYLGLTSLPVLPIVALVVVLASTAASARFVESEHRAAALGRGLARVLSLGLVLAPLVPLWLWPVVDIGPQAAAKSLAAALVLCLTGLSWSLGRLMTGMASRLAPSTTSLPTEEPVTSSTANRTRQRQTT